MGTICVVGGANIDLCGRVTGELRPYDSNPGIIDVSFGGVGRNIAEVCAALGSPVRFVTAFSRDLFGKQLKEDCIAKGMDCGYCRETAEASSSIYLAILDGKRDMHIAVNDMRILDLLSREDVLAAVNDLGRDDWLVLDGNLREELLESLLKERVCRTAADPVSVSKCGKFLPVLSGLDVFKPNQYEAARLSGITVKDEESAAALLEWFLERGVGEIIVSLAGRGVLLGCGNMKRWITHREIILENATGGGDTFLGAYLSERNRGASPQEAVRFASAAAVCVISRTEGRGSLKREDVLRTAEMMEIKERDI